MAEHHQACYQGKGPALGEEGAFKVENDIATQRSARGGTTMGYQFALARYDIEGTWTGAFMGMARF
jgi:hypothetical protein